MTKSRRRTIIFERAVRNSCNSNTVGGKKPATVGFSESLFEIYRKVFNAGEDLGTEQDIECSESFLVAIDALNKYQYTDNIQFFSDPKADLTDRIDVLTKQELIRDNMQLEQNLENTREQLNKTLADPQIGVCCGRIKPQGKGIVYYYQKFEYS